MSVAIWMLINAEKDKSVRENEEKKYLPKHPWASKSMGVCQHWRRRHTRTQSNTWIYHDSFHFIICIAFTVCQVIVMDLLTMKRKEHISSVLGYSHTRILSARARTRPTFRENQPLSRTMRVRPFHLFINHTSYARTPTQMPAVHSYIWYIRDSHARASSKLPSACECVVRRRISFRAGEMERRRCLSV